MTDFSKPISASNPPPSKGQKKEQKVNEPLVTDEAVKKSVTKKTKNSK